MRPVCASCRLGLEEVPWPACNRCGAPQGSGRPPECLDCAELPELVERVRARAVHASPASGLLQAAGRGGWTKTADFMAREVARLIRPGPMPRDIVVPAPSLRAGGPDASEVIARGVARQLDVEFFPALGSRVLAKSLKRRASGRTLNREFFLKSEYGPRVRPHRVLLVFGLLESCDVLAALARALKGAAPQQIHCYAFARPPS